MMLIWMLVCSTVAGTVLGQDTYYFSLKPRDQDVVEGVETTLQCDVSDRRHIYFQWTQQGKPVVNTTRRFQEDSNLRILRVLRDEDAGPFQCIATNATTGFSLQSFEASLNIEWIDERADVELKRPKKEEVKEGVDVILKCLIRGNPEPKILWYHNKFRLFNTDRVKILDDGSRLKLVNITASDNGIYSCRAENRAGAVDSSENFLLNVQAGTPYLLEEQFTPYKIVQRNSPARLDCAFVGASRIDWFSNYEKLSNGTRHTVYPNGSLFFPKVRAADEGSYRCEGLSRTSPPGQTFTSELVLASLGEIMRDTFEPRLQANYPIVIPVHTRSEIRVFPPDGRPKPNFWWQDRNDLRVPDAGRMHVKDNLLVFESPQEIDSGNYTFVVNNTAGQKTRSVWIMVSVPPIISRAPQPETVEEDSSVELSCQVVGTQYPVTRITWSKDGVALPLFSTHYRMDEMTGILRIVGVTMADMGNYACLANTSGHPVVSSSHAYLTVTKRLKFHPVPKNSQLEVNQIGQVVCHAEAETPPQVRWVKRGTEVFNMPPHVIQRSGTLVFSPALHEDAGYYTCVATHPRQGLINATILIEIVEKPVITIEPKNVTVFEGEPSLLHCVAKGMPLPSISWYRDGQLILPDPRRYTIFQNGTIHIHHVFIEDYGKYACVANNSAGTERKEFYIRVANPMEEDENFNMVKTIIIAVCSAGAYLALVIGLTAFCSYRLLIQRRGHKGLPLKTENGDLHREQHELLMKDRDSGTQFRSDSDNRSHASALSSHPSHSSQSQHSRSRRPSFDRFHYPRHELHTLGIMGKGCFGDVFLAKARSLRLGDQETLVVVKSLLTKGENEVREFCAEMEMFARMDHPNVVKLIGVCREQEPHFLITEYCDWGDLKQFLLATRSDNGRRGTRVPPLTTCQKLSMGQQVAAGMEALTAAGLVHSDLAARNILLSSRMQLKVARPALSADVYASEYYPLHHRLVPLRWLSPEAATEDQVTSAGDVWAFGVFLWEVMELADLPYRLSSDEEVLCALRLGHANLESSEHFPPNVLELVRRCTLHQASQRPTFSEVCSVLSQLMTSTDVV
ncbi:inactive tyrosine-protein kinase 7-like isoform X2 [Pomacea canaliculata]|uniref:inactive tyrosine-protein kinase 7-like isoform X2 n=1 Tax=Pomacea canaliculata TaxID=400727 RepID=UPI000D732DA3|nr:inactive tyrosine-protein kinase 7-like isoform X2 [Pomacea canaliculata]